MLDLKLYLDSGAQSGLKSLDILIFLLKINLIQRPHNFKILGLLDGKLFEVQIQQPYGNFPKRRKLKIPRFFSDPNNLFLKQLRNFTSVKIVRQMSGMRSFRNYAFQRLSWKCAASSFNCLKSVAGYSFRAMVKWLNTLFLRYQVSLNGFSLTSSLKWSQACYMTWYCSEKILATLYIEEQDLTLRQWREKSLDWGINVGTWRLREGPYWMTPRITKCGRKKWISHNVSVYTCQ